MLWFSHQVTQRISMYLCALSTVLFAQSAFSEIYRYEINFPVRDEVNQLNFEVELVFDIWHGNGERVLISAGYMRQMILRPDVKTTTRHYRTQDVGLFESRSGPLHLDLVLGQRPDDSMNVKVTVRANMVDIQGDFPGIDHHFSIPTPEKILEPFYQPKKISGAPKAFETGNASVPMEIFFANKGVQFNLDQQRVLKSEEEEKKTSTITSHKESWESKPSEPLHTRSLQDEAAYLDFNLDQFTDDAKELIKSPTKPYLRDLSALMRKVQVHSPKFDLRQNPFNRFKNVSSLFWGMEQMGLVVQQLEAIYPGAIWYILGRDAYLFGDALEAEYIGRGELDRVVRLPASRPSFNGADLPLVNDFLKSFGVDVDTMKDGDRPRIVLDVTSYSNSTYNLSQSRHLMRAAYQRWVDLGRDPKHLLNLLNFVNLASYHSKGSAKDQNELEGFQSRLEFKPEPDTILTVESPNRFLYSDAWHSIYEKFQRLEDGSVTTTFNEAGSTDTRVRMLAELWDIMVYHGPEEMMKALDGSCEQVLQ